MAKSDTERESDKRIMKLFRGRCIVCFMPATEIHELIPRSRSKQAITMPQNRVPLCNGKHKFSHRDVHHDGYTQPKEDFLRNKAIERLIQFGEKMESW